MNRPSITRRILSSGKPEIIADVLRDPDYWSAGADLRSMLAVPIQDHGRPMGTIELFSPRTSEFTHVDIGQVQRVASYVGQLIKRVEESETARRAEARLEYTAQLRDLTSPLYDWKDLNQAAIYRLRAEILQRIIAWSLDETQSQAGVIFQSETVEDRDYPELELRAQIGAPIADAPVRLVNREIARLRAKDSHEIRDSWHTLRQTLLDRLRAMTGVTKATIFAR